MVFVNLFLPISNSFADVKTEEKQLSEKKIKEEIISQRTKNSKTFFDENSKTFMCEVYNEPIHYLSEDKSLKEIDNELIETNKKGFKYENKANEFKIYFCELSGEKDFIWFQAGKNGISINPISMRYVGKEFKKNKEDRKKNKQLVRSNKKNAKDKKPEIVKKVVAKKNKKTEEVKKAIDKKAEENNKLTYQGIFKDVDFSYTVKGDMLKEDIIMHRYNDKNTFSFEVNLDNLYMEKSKNGKSILIKEKETNKLITVYRAPYMKDSKGVKSKNILLELREENDKYYIDVIIDEEWLKSEKRAYPVVIDPILYHTNFGPKDTYVRSECQHSNFYDDYSLEVGYNQLAYDWEERIQAMQEWPWDADEYCEAYIKFDLPKLPSGAIVVYANFTANTYEYYSWDGHKNLGKINVHRITSPWNPDKVTWDTKPAYGPVEASAKLIGGEWGLFTLEDEYTGKFWGETDTYRNGTYSVDITPLCVDWYSGFQPNYGLALTGNDKLGVASFRSSEVSDRSQRPRITFFYCLDSLGVDSEWGFTSELTNVYNGNLVEQAVDMFISGRGEPINITRTYNSRSKKEGIFGKNWTSNLETSLEYSDGAINLYDADGTEYIFLHWIDNVYISKTTPGAATGGGASRARIVKESNGTYTLKQNDGTVISLNTNGKITRITDKNNNITTYNYNTSTGKLQSISDPSGRTITFSYGENGKVKQAMDFSGKKVQYNYDNSNRLISVVDQNNKTITYQYDSNNNLTKIIYPNGNFITYGYDKYDRVITVTRKITVNGTLSTSTSVITYDPANYCTTITDANGHKVSYEYDYMGKLIKVSEDPEGLNYRNLINYDTRKKRLTSVADANTVASGGNTSYVINYDDYGRINSATNSLNQSTDINYSGTNHIVTFGESTAQTVSDMKGNIIQTIDSFKQGNTMKYDRYGNIVEQTETISAADNIVTNSSFENNLTDWKLSIQPDCNANKIITQETSKFGNKSLRISNPNGWIEYANNSAVTYDPTKTYTFSGYIKANNLSTNAAYLKVKCYNSSGVFLGSVDSYHIKDADDWTRINLVLSSDKVPAGTTKIIPAIAMKATSGTAYFDGIQLEEGANLSTYNYLSNSSFEKDVNKDGIPDDWEAHAPYELNNGENQVFHGEVSVRVMGDKSFSDIYLSQYVDLSIPANTDLTLSGWSEAWLASQQGGFYGIRAIVKYKDNTTKSYDFEFNKNNSHSWEQLVGNIHLEKEATGITIQCKFDSQNGFVRFDGIRLQEGKNTTQIQYDSLGNYPISVTNVLGDTINMKYTNSGNLSKVMDSVGKSMYFGYDNLDRITSVNGPLESNSQYTYDANGNMLSAKDPNNHIIAYRYNEVDAIATITDPLNKSTRFSYDLAGNLTKTTYPTGGTIGFGYNAVDRLEEIKYNGDTKYIYKYDPNGNCTEITDKVTNKTTSFNYNKLDALTKSIDSKGNQTNYSYNNGGEITALTGQFGSYRYNANYNYDDLGRVRKVIGNGISAEYAYNEKGLPVSFKLGNGGYSVNSYDEANRLSKIVNYTDNGKILSSDSYKYDSRGNIIAITTLKGITNFEYDDLCRLIKEIIPNGTIIEYSYDAAGNRLTKKVTKRSNRQTICYSYDAANQMTVVDGQRYTYDNNGNLLSDGSRRFVYNVANDLIEVKNSTGETLASFTYDALGRRNSMTTGRNTVYYHYSGNGNKVICETDSNNNILASYTYDGYGNLISMTRNGNKYYYHYNGHGDVIALTDSNSNTVATYEYDSFGKVIKSSGNVINPYRYAGYRYDENIGLYYLNARYYNPETGRFITRDTFNGFIDNPQSLNLYTYCYNNPIVYTDPNGHSPCYCPDDPLQDGLTEVYDFLIGDDINTLVDPNAHIGMGVLAAVSIGSNFFGGGIAKGAKLLLKTKKGAKLLKWMGKSDDLFKINLQLFASKGKHIFPKSNREFKSILGIDKKVFHKEVKPVILKQIKGDSSYGKIFNKMGKNPDIGINELGNIVLKDVKNGKRIETDWRFEHFLP
ncbi:DNRLRE domain-containing protein [Inediibacterium massiliense]|uniref:DNRLRE domain-containing protein n=1 Tax=Inediibacterium massiliense TaxID=1658111 RepID=UPI001A9A643C|nr:DNRLRE domain-containing protein [Inediibacterium massiliense]